MITWKNNCDFFIHANLGPKLSLIPNGIKTIYTQYSYKIQMLGTIYILNVHFSFLKKMLQPMTRKWMDRQTLKINLDSPLLCFVKPTHI